METLWLASGSDGKGNRDGMQKIEPKVTRQSGAVRASVHQLFVRKREKRRTFSSTETRVAAAKLTECEGFKSETAQAPRHVNPPKTSPHTENYLLRALQINKRPIFCSN